MVVCLPGFVFVRQLKPSDGELRASKPEVNFDSGPVRTCYEVYQFTKVSKISSKISDLETPEQAW